MPITQSQHCVMGRHCTGTGLSRCLAARALCNASVKLVVQGCALELLCTSRGACIAAPQQFVHIARIWSLALCACDCASYGSQLCSYKCLTRVSRYEWSGAMHGLAVSTLLANINSQTQCMSGRAQCVASLFGHSGCKHKLSDAMYERSGTMHGLAVWPLWYERSGTMHGLFRARGFTQDDGHIFCLPNQISSEIVGVLDLMEQVLSTFGFSKYEVNLSTRPEKSVGRDAVHTNQQPCLHFLYPQI
eukprot:1159194-Pelagomonas_calceolata.AAC.4